MEKPIPEPFNPLVLLGSNVLVCCNFHRLLIVYKIVFNHIMFVELLEFASFAIFVLRQMFIFIIRSYDARLLCIHIDLLNIFGV